MAFSGHHARKRFGQHWLKDESVLPAMLSMLARAAVIRITGGERKAPFFTPDDQPVAKPTVLTLEERNAARAKTN